MLIIKFQKIQKSKNFKKSQTHLSIATLNMLLYFLLGVLTCRILPNCDYTVACFISPLTSKYIRFPVTFFERALSCSTVQVYYNDGLFSASEHLDCFLLMGGTIANASMNNEPLDS